ncbi:DUF6906 family protein [Clostridium sp. UBA1652]|uniref:DUF6906 family protein n=1 Tax=Clostridium sp. UBA1652 TaxID=1946348 RepID=UPI00257AD13A|nr:hypothetical protein [Clostridium sp. UBA1652]
MKHAKKLTRSMKKALKDLNLNPSNYLYTKRDHESFTPYNKITEKELHPVRY